VNAAALAGQAVALDYKAGPATRMIDFHGYRYTRTPSEVSGALMTRYDETKPETWHVPLRDDVQPSLSAPAPRAGYLIPVEQAAQVAPKLAVHGIEFRVLDTPLAAVPVEAYRASSAVPEGKSVEGHQRLKLQGNWQPERVDLAAGALYVPVAQAKARLVMAMLEPQAPDSLLAWGEFNNFFEQKEYMEPYVAEQVAREQLAADPALAEAFARRLREDAAFAADPAARLDFFYRRHSAWDANYNRYPVLRSDSAPR
ncbi:MAG: peptidase M14, partial [Arenimonas sp.]